MGHKSIIYKIIKETKPPTFPFEFQSLIFKSLVLANFFANCKSLASSITKTGTTATVTSSILKRRQQLGLPEVSRFDQVEIKKIAYVTRLCKISEEEI